MTPKVLLLSERTEESFEKGKNRGLVEGRNQENKRGACITMTCEVGPGEGSASSRLSFTCLRFSVCSRYHRVPPCKCNAHVHARRFSCSF